MINRPENLLLWLNLYACINRIHLFMLFMLTLVFYDKLFCPIVCEYIILLLRLLIVLFIWLIMLIIC